MESKKVTRTTVISHDLRKTRIKIRTTPNVREKYIKPLQTNEGVKLVDAIPFLLS